MFHITLAYAYTATAEALRDAIAAAVGAKITCVGKAFTLDRPKLCYFEDMRAFIPWDASGSPWGRTASA